ncbi:hypothetical protein ACFL23_00425 [Patescibacteria group bacterium]
MKLFIAILSLLFGIIIGTAITTFLIVKKSPMIQNFLCVNSEEQTNINSESLSDFFNTIKNNDSEETTTTIQKEIKENIENIAQEGDENEIFTKAGPGECKTEDECLEYCLKLENLKECLDFIKQYGFEPTQ